ncbi:MAG: hypothetical protein DI626_09475, partial [Micavibrio aeruginosavorus]
EWNVDKAASFFGDGTKFSNLLARKGNDLFDAPDLERFICLCYKLGRPDICLAITKKYHDKRYGRLVEKISGGVYRNLPFKSSHSRVLNNIIRLADVPLPKKLLKKSDGNESPVAFVGFNFLALPSDPLIGRKPINASFIPHPWGGGAELDSNQSWEYHHAFYDIKDICLIKKYLYVRALALCEALVLHNSDPKTIRLELNLLNEVFKEEWLIRVQKFCAFISELSIEDQNLRRNFLKKLHVTSMQKIADLRRQREYVEASRINDNFVLSIESSSRFLDNAVYSMDRLAMALETGFLDGPKERNRQKHSWKAVVDFRHENRPTGGWSSIEKYIDACLAFSAQTDHVEEFQICYYYNTLTIFFAKQKRWADVRERLEQMFSLPERFFRRSNKSELEALRRRYARSKSMT